MDEYTGTKNCQVVISATDGNPETRDVVSYYSLWETFMGIRAVCVRSNRAGVAMSLGRLMLDSARGW